MKELIPCLCDNWTSSVGITRRSSCYYTWTLCKRDRTSRFVVMRARTRRQGILTSKRRNAIWCQPESAMFCAHLSHFGYVVQLLPERGFSYRACDEEMSKPSLVLTLLKIISQNQWYIVYIDFVLQLIVYLNISKAVALKVLISIVGLCLP